MKISHPPLTAEQVKVLESAPYRLSPLSNAAQGTLGCAVMYLVRLGLLVETERHITDDPCGGWTEYDRPAEAKKRGDAKVISLR